MGDIKPAVVEAWSQITRPTYTVEVKFMIPNFGEEQRMCVIGEELKSKPFYVDGKEFQLGFQPAGRINSGYGNWVYDRNVFLHNHSDVKVRVKTDLRVGGLKTGMDYIDIEPRKCFKKLVSTNGIPHLKLTGDGSLEIEGTVTLIGQAVAVGRDAT